MKFEVMSIKSEKKQNGNSRIEFRSMEDESIIFSLALPSKLLDQPDAIRKQAEERYSRIAKEREADKEYKVKVGMIL